MPGLQWVSQMHIMHKSVSRPQQNSRLRCLGKTTWGHPRCRGLRKWRYYEVRKYVSNWKKNEVEEKKKAFANFHLLSSSFSSSSIALWLVFVHAHTNLTACEAHTHNYSACLPKTGYLIFNNLLLERGTEERRGISVGGDIDWKGERLNESNES